MTQTHFRAGYLVLLGEPNVGKSSVLNRLLDFKLSIISPRPQTTRRRIIGIISGDDYQIVVCDTPGYVQPKYKLQETYIHQIKRALFDADIVCLITEIKKPEMNPSLLDALKIANKPVILAINKIDQSEKSAMLPVIEMMKDVFPFSAIVPISALKQDGMVELKTEMIKCLPEHPPYYDSTTMTEQPERFFVAEYIREQIFNYFQHEIPYTTEVQVEEFKERKGRKDYIRAVIYTEKQSQKGIIIGHGGEALKEIGIRARKRIEQFLDRHVFLELQVKISKDWRRDELKIKQFGY